MQVPGRDTFSSSSLPELSSDKDANIVNVLATLCGCSQANRTDLRVNFCFITSWCLTPLLPRNMADESTTTVS